MKFKTYRGSRVNRSIRRCFAAAALQGMLASTPMCDRTKINKDKWAKIAFAWADSMMRAE